MDPQLIQAMMSGEGTEDDPRIAQLTRQQKMAEQMRNDSMQQRQGQMVSGHFVAPSPLDYVSQLVQGYQAKKMQGQVDQGMTDMSKARAGNRAKYYDALTMALRRPFPQPSGPVLPPDGMEDR